MSQDPVRPDPPPGGPEPREPPPQVTGEEIRHPRRGGQRASLALAALCSLLLGAGLSGAGAFVGAEGAGIVRWVAAPALCLLGLAVAVVAVVFWIARSEVVLVHANGIAVALAGRLRQRLFWKDLTNVIEDAKTGAFEIYARRIDLSKVPPGEPPPEAGPHAVHEHLSVNPRSLERGEELRERIRREWDNVWGQKLSTSSEVAFFYSALVKSEARDRAALTRLGVVALGVLLAVAAVAWTVTVTHESTRADLPWRGGLVFGTAILFFSEVAAIRGWQRAKEAAREIEVIGGVQFGEEGLRVFSDTGDLREIPFAEMAAIDLGPPIEVRPKSGETLRLHAELAWFDKFRDWLLDDAKARGVTILASAPPGPAHPS